MREASEKSHEVAIQARAAAHNVAELDTTGATSHSTHTMAWACVMFCWFVLSFFFLPEITEIHFKLSQKNLSFFILHSFWPHQWMGKKSHIKALVSLKLSFQK